LTSSRRQLRGRVTSAQYWSLVPPGNRSRTPGKELLFEMGDSRKAVELQRWTNKTLFKKQKIWRSEQSIGIEIKDPPVLKTDTMRDRENLDKAISNDQNSESM
jgi:hypothetical protein